MLWCECLNLCISCDILIFMNAVSDTPINVETFYSFVGDDPEAARDMADLFIRQAKDYLIELGALTEEGDERRWHDVAHKFKGMASFAGADALRRSCAKAQENHAASPSTKREIYTMVETDVDRAIVHIAELTAKD